MKIKRLSEYKGARMVQVMVRLPPPMRDQLKEIVAQSNNSGQKVTEADVCRNAIEFFLQANSTFSRDGAK